jgi:hypothetical protein
MPVRMVRSVRPNPDASLKIGTSVLAEDAEYRILDFSDGVLGGQPIFLGYGLEVPQHGWNDYGEHDVRGRTVVVFTGAPPQVAERLSDAERYLLSDGAKAAVAMARGARGILIVNDPRGHGDGTGQREDRMRELRPDFPLAGFGAARVTKRAATRIFAGMGLDLAEYQRSLDIRHQSVELMFDVVGDLHLERDTITAHNVIGKIDGGEGPPLVIGAHYDHLGLGGPASLFKGRKALHPGADDNASGVAVLLEVAARLRKIASSRPIYFVALTGEERALRGSRTLARVFVDRRAKQGTTFINLDMVGRLGIEDLLVYATDDSGSRLRIGDGATHAGISLDWRGLRDANSDHVPFAELGWEAIGLSTGRHSDYHRPGDTVDKIDWRGLGKIADFVSATVRLLATK